MWKILYKHLDLEGGVQGPGGAPPAPPPLEDLELCLGFSLNFRGGGRGGHFLDRHRISKQPYPPGIRNDKLFTRELLGSVHSCCTREVETMCSHCARSAPPVLLHSLLLGCRK